MLRLLSPGHVQSLAASIGSKDPSVAQAVQALLSPNPAHRPDPSALLTNAMFHQTGVTTLRRLDTLPTLAQRDPTGVSSFLSGQLPGALALVNPPRLRRTAVLTQLLACAKGSPALWPFVLPVVFAVLEDPETQVSKQMFREPYPQGYPSHSPPFVPGRE